MDRSSERLRVGVIFGGRSGEHEVSLLSAASVIQAMDRRRFQPVPIGITKDGRWLAGAEAVEVLREAARLPSVGAMAALTAQARNADTAPRAPEVALLPDPTREGLLATPAGLSPEEADQVSRLDVVFPVLHGPLGEDGTIQGLLELAGLPYVGAGVLGSALGMDKIAMKDVFRAHGLPVVSYLPFSRSGWERDPRRVRERIQAELRFPVFVKPANLGSSVGVTKVRSAAQLDSAIAVAAQYDRRIIVEEAAGDVREIECSVLGNDDPVASVPGEIIPSREFYDYEAKYLDEGSRLAIPADLPQDVVAAVQDLAIRAFLALDAAGMARVDFFVGREDNSVTVNELNTIPGFTSISMYPKLWEASGLDYSDLITKLIELALTRYADRRRVRTTYDLPGRTER